MYIHDIKPHVHGWYVYICLDVYIFSWSTFQMKIHDKSFFD